MINRKFSIFFVIIFIAVFFIATTAAFAQKQPQLKLDGKCQQGKAMFSLINHADSEVKVSYDLLKTDIKGELTLSENFAQTLAFDTTSEVMTLRVKTGNKSREITVTCAG